MLVATLSLFRLATYVIDGRSKGGLNAVLVAQLAHKPQPNVGHKPLLENDRQKASGEVERKYGQD